MALEKIQKANDIKELTEEEIAKKEKQEKRRERYERYLVFGCIVYRI